jgi:hypothetical protein
VVLEVAGSSPVGDPTVIDQYALTRKGRDVTMNLPVRDLHLRAMSTQVFLLEAVYGVSQNVRLTCHGLTRAASQKPPGQENT